MGNMDVGHPSRHHLYFPLEVVHLRNIIMCLDSLALDITLHSLRKLAIGQLILRPRNPGDPLVNVYITMENHHAINGKTHYFYGHFQ